MTTAFKFIGKNKKGLYDFVHCTAPGQAIDTVQAFLKSKGWSELEFQTTYNANGKEEYSFNS